METKKRYYKDPYEAAFSARVLSCEPAGESYRVVLDETAFYPEGGGQPSDHGTLGAVQVTDVHEKDGIIVHTCTGPLEVGAQVDGAIDWARRFDFMQQHSGEHIVSGLIHQRFGYDNVGFHLGAEVVTIDFNGMISPASLVELEEQANEMIWRNAASVITFPSREQLDQLDFRSKKELTGQVRIVEFPGADVCACCGTHVARTGEIGLIKILSCQKFHSGVRLELVCGRRALHYVQEVFRQNSATAVLLSAKERQTAAVVRKLHDDFAQAKLRISQMEQDAFARKALELAGAGDVLLFEDGLTADGVRRLASAVLEQCGGRCAVFSGDDAQGYKYCVGKSGGDVRALVKALNQQLNGRGGGKPDFAQGSVQTGRSAIETFFREEADRQR